MSLFLKQSNKAERTNESAATMLEYVLLLTVMTGMIVSFSLPGSAPEKIKTSFLQTSSLLSGGGTENGDPAPPPPSPAPEADKNKPKDKLPPKTHGGSKPI